MERSRLHELRGGARIPELDGVRGVAICLVLVLHWLVRPNRQALRDWSPRLWALLDLSWCGVDLFFVLSGFLIAGILLDHLDAPNLFGTFYVRRACRILPAYLLLLGVATLPLPGGAVLGHGEVPLLAYLGFVQNLWSAAGARVAPALAPCWSLAIEEQFYLSLPVLLVLLFPRRFASLAALALVVPLLSRCLCIASGRWSAWDFTPCRIDAPFWGVLAAALVRGARSLDLLRRHLRLLRAAAFAGICAAAASSQLVLRDGGEDLLVALGPSLLGAAFAAALVAILLTPESVAAAALRARPLRWVGQRCYFLYLFHVLVFEALPVPAPALRVLAAAGALLALAWASWRWLETPFLRLGAAVGYAGARPPATVPDLRA